MDTASFIAPVKDSPPHQQLPWATSAATVDSLEPNVTRPPISTTINPKKRPSAISIRAFLIGVTFGISITLTLLALRPPSRPLWRASFFIASLSTFHFLEFYITALYNPPAATTSAFLLTTNGYSYNVAHTLALIECVFGNYVAPRYFPEQMYMHPLDALWPTGGTARFAWLTLGFILLVLGQVIRTLAMVHAGTNFNHLIQFRKKEGHVLVTDGIYRWLRHPSYFGFFWWGLGTQIVMGNEACLIGYAMVLWRFFRFRIEKEESLLIEFFGQDYIRYREKTTVGIPLIS